MEKVIKNGKVAVLYSPGFGAGWYSWNDKEEILFLPEVVELVENKQHDKIEELLKNKGYDFYMGGARDLEIKWIPEGTLFRINEYDGSESIEYLDIDNSYIKA